MERQEPRVTGRYPNIPDHSDLRGFTYRAPENYQWSDDHEEPGFNREMEFVSSPRSVSDHAWKSLRGFLGHGPKGYRRSDERILEDVCEALMQHSGIDAGDLEVKVKDGIVTLKGTVPNRWMKRASEWVADRVPGVRDIRNELNLS